MNCFPEPPPEIEEEEVNGTEIYPNEMIRNEPLGSTLNVSSNVSSSSDRGKAGSKIVSSVAPDEAPIIKIPDLPSPAELMVLKLQQENRKLRVELEKSQEEVLRWRNLSKNLFNTLILSPENCQYLKKVTTEQMSNALKNVDHEVQFVDCSFPSAPTNAPELELLSTTNASSSQWDLKWDPNWSVKV